MKKSFSTVIVSTFVFVGAVNGSATIVTTAPGIYGYEWLEFSHTARMTRDTVETTLLGSGQPFIDYRYATRLETELLLDSYYKRGTGDLHNDGMDIGLSPWTYDAAADFLDDFGYYADHIYEWDERAALFYYGSQYELEQLLAPEDTYLGYVYERNNGFTAMMYGEEPTYEGLFGSNFGTNANGAGYRIRKNEYYENGFDNSHMSMSLLVKSPTTPAPTPAPEPTTIILISAGILGLIRSKTRRKK